MRGSNRIGFLPIFMIAVIEAYRQALRIEPDSSDAWQDVKDVSARKQRMDGQQR